MATDPGLIPPGNLAKTNTFLVDIFDKRSKITAGGNSVWMIENYGGALVETSAFEPDPTTYRGDYYYNTVMNVLYKKVVTEHKPELGHIIAHWKRIS